MNTICFTNLGTVHCMDFELTNSLFFEKMNKKIKEQPDENKVSYDKENDKYLIMYNTHVYEVNYRNEKLDKYCPKPEIIEMLNKLVEISNSQKEIRVIEEKTSKKEKKYREKLYKNVIRGLVTSNDEKRAKISLLKEEREKNKLSFFKGIADVFKKMNYGKSFEERGFWEGLIFPIPFLIAGIIFAFIGKAYFFLGSWIVAVSIMIDALVWNKYHINEVSYRGYLMSIISVLALPFNVLYNAVKKLVDYIKHQSSINKIKRSITDFGKTKEFAPVTKVNINEVSKFLDKVTNKKGDRDHETYKRTIEIINELKNRVVLIKDEKISKKYALELYEIINYYIEVSNKKRGFDKEKILRLLFSQIRDLKEKVEDELRKEMEEEKNNNDYNTLIENIEYQKSIGTR